MNERVVDFQKLTAERIVHIYRTLGHRRVLLADEVGLGKTYVARQVINLVREWHKEMKDDFFKVVYICSNANIAEQNIEKLGVKNKMSISESRLSMQHLMITKLEKDISNSINKSEMPESIIPLTPNTSFRFYSQRGTAQERALMYNILKHLPQLDRCKRSLNSFLSDGVKNWKELIAFYDGKTKENGREYVENMLDKLRPFMTDEFVQTLVETVNKEGKCSSIEKSEIINKLRCIFAEISIEMLDPDLVIMDEFQRFSDLLQYDDSEQSMLAKHFFDPSNSNTKILLLSATPYKPFSTLEEVNIDGDEHYGDFKKVMEFLHASEAEKEKFMSVWKKYSTALKATDVADLAPLIEAKVDAENSLYRVTCRTERFNTGIINDAHVKAIPVMVEDILSYAQGQKLIDYLHNHEKSLRIVNMPMEYVKSSPYMLSFMDKYVLKKNIVDAIQDLPIQKDCKLNTLLLSRYNINNYREIILSNGRLKFLHDMLFAKLSEKNTHLLLWVPASNPYYKVGGIFESKEARQFSKILLFSSWEMVPRMVSTMLSYYAEYYTLGRLKSKENAKEIKYVYASNADETTSSRKKRYGQNRIKTGNIFEYPCHALADIYKPEEYYGMNLLRIQDNIKAQLHERIEELKQATGIQLEKGRSNAENILKIMKLLDGDILPEGEKMYIPKNAENVLTNIAIASPSVCAYRRSHDKDDALLAGRAIVSLFNKPESAAIIDLLYNKQSEDDYYASVLDYCANGNLQAVFDEYAHMLGTNKIGKHLGDAILETSILNVDTKESFGRRKDKLSMRCHFAIPFIDKTITEKSVNRTSNIRKAFNSPFRPFVLSTTSIGQEGLDFHWYARKVVHWNLPSNPIDIEQREGRVNRYKCLAIRRNVAHLYATDKYKSWDELFSMAKTELKNQYSELVPYWCLPINLLSEEQKEKLEYIERIVPLYPFSRDGSKYHWLIDVLSLYRMTLGQPRQEELLNLLRKMNLSEEQLKELTIDLSPYNHKKKGGNFSI